MKRRLTYAVLSLTVISLGFSKLVLAGTVSGSGWVAETSGAPALTFYNGNVVVAWEGAPTKNFGFSFGPDWSTETFVDYDITTQPPAVATANETLYFAWRGPSSAATDKIYYEAYDFSAPQAPICNTSGTCAETTSAPALASNASTLYAAWTTVSDTILVASYNATSWTFPTAAIPGASTTAAPALAIDGETLYAAWLEKGTSNVMYASLPITGGSWSTPAQVEGTADGTAWKAQTSVAPALGVSTVPAHIGLFLAWTAPATTSGEYTIQYSYFTGSGWGQPIPIAVPTGASPANVTPALLGYTINYTSSNYFSFNAAYTLTNGEIEWTVLQADTIVRKPLPCGCPTCCY